MKNRLEFAVFIHQKKFIVKKNGVLGKEISCNNFCGFLNRST